MAVAIQWPDGEQTRAVNWRKLLQRIRAMQWSSFDSESDFKESLRERARLWNPDAAVVTDGNAREFFFSLADTGMIEITDDRKEDVIIQFPNRGGR